MTTIRQIERAWVAKDYDRLLHELLMARPEASLRLGFSTGLALPTAAMAVVRLDELSQTHVPLYGRLIRTIVAAQEADGGWGDPVVTALCLRALLCGGGDGVCIDRGMGYLANLQKAEGLWPAVPLRRMPADPFVSAVILQQLGDAPAFRSVVRFADAVLWFEMHEGGLDDETRRVWELARVRCRLRPLAPGADTSVVEAVPVLS